MDQIKCEIRSGKGKKRQVLLPLPRDRDLVLGRGQTADVRLDVADVSREHVRLRWNNKASTYEILGLASTNRAYFLPEGNESASALQEIPNQTWTPWKVNDVLVLGSAFLSLELAPASPLKVQSAPSNGSEQASAGKPIKSVPAATMIMSAEQLKESEEATARKSGPGSGVKAPDSTTAKPPPSATMVMNVGETADTSNTTDVGTPSHESAAMNPASDKKSAPPVTKVMSRSDTGPVETGKMAAFVEPAGGAKSGRNPSKQARLAQLSLEIQETLVRRVNLSKLASEAENDSRMREEVRRQIGFIIKDLIRSGRITEREGFQAEKKAFEDILGYGPLQDLLDDPAISEIMVVAPDQIYSEQSGKLLLTDRAFLSDEHARQVLRRLLRASGRPVNEANPIVNATLEDGSRLHAVLPPIALKGATITIRKFHRNLSVQQLIDYGSLNKGMATFLRLAVEARMNIVVSGGTGSGKTTLLNVLSSFIPEDQRIVTVEDTAELALMQAHVVRLQSRPKNSEGVGGISIRELVIESLRMRPDRIIVGECRSAEALDMLQAMNTGHDGSLTTVHANTAVDALHRLETMVLYSGMDLPMRAIMEQIRSAVNLVVQQSRLVDGKRKITEIVEVTSIEDEQIRVQPIFKFEMEKMDAKGVVGHHYWAGHTPAFIHKLKMRGVEVPAEIFAS